MATEEEKLELQKLRAIAEKIKAYVDAHSGEGTNILPLNNTFTGNDNFTGGLQKNGQDVVVMSNVIQVGETEDGSLSINGLLFTPATEVDLNPSTETSSGNISTVKLGND